MSQLQRDLRYALRTIWWRPVLPTEPVKFAAVALGLALIAVLAAYLPGRRATGVDPRVALRTE